MKKLLLLLPLLLAPTPVMAQRVNYTQICTQYREVYTPGGYDYYGYYYPGKVTSEAYTVLCNQVNSGWRPSNQYYNNSGNGYYGRRTNPNCNPIRTTLGAVLGGSIGRSMTSTRNNRNNRGWATALGASIGGLAFSC
jgi:hypothetical protein